MPLVSERMAAILARYRYGMRLDIRKAAANRPLTVEERNLVMRPSVTSFQSTTIYLDEIGLAVPLRRRDVIREGAPEIRSNQSNQFLEESHGEDEPTVMCCAVDEEDLEYEEELPETQCLRRKLREELNIGQNLDFSGRAEEGSARKRSVTFVFDADVDAPVPEISTTLPTTDVSDDDDWNIVEPLYNTMTVRVKETEAATAAEAGLVDDCDQRAAQIAAELNPLQFPNAAGISPDGSPAFMYSALSSSIPLRYTGTDSASPTHALHAAAVTTAQHVAEVVGKSETKVSGTERWFNVKSGNGIVIRNATKEEVSEHQSSVVQNSAENYKRPIGDGELVELEALEGHKGPETANVVGFGGSSGTSDCGCSGDDIIDQDDTKVKIFVHQPAVVKNNPEKYLQSVKNGALVEPDVVGRDEEPTAPIGSGRSESSGVFGNVVARGMIALPDCEYDINITKSDKPAFVQLGQTFYSVKKFLRVPAHVMRRFPRLIRVFKFGGGVRMWLLHHQFLRLIKAASKREPTSDRRFAMMMYSFLNYSNATAAQLDYFVEFVAMSGAPETLLLDLARPDGYAIRSYESRTVKDWIDSFLAGALLYGGSELAVKMASRLDCFGVAKRILGRSAETGNPLRFGLDAAKNAIWYWTRSYIHAQLALRDHSDLGLMVDYPECEACGMLLRPGVSRTHIDIVAHMALCEKRTVVFTRDRRDLDYFERVPFPPAGPFGPVDLVPAGNCDRIFGSVYTSFLSGAPEEVVFILSRVTRFF